MGTSRARRVIAAGLAVLGALLTGAAAAQAPNPVFSPDLFRESITAENLRSLGFTPQEYALEIPLGGSVSLSRQYLRTGDTGMFSMGVTERNTDALSFALNKRGSLLLSQDEAYAALPFGLSHSRSRTRKATLTQGFGADATTGMLTLAHEDTYAEQSLSGFSRSQTDSAALTMGLSKALGLTAGAATSSAFSQGETNTRRYDATLIKPGSSDPALAEYHYSETVANGVASEVTQTALRTPTIKVGDVATVGASQVRTDSTAGGTETTNALNLSAKPDEAVTVSATHAATNRSASADTAATSVSSQIKVTSDTTVSAAYSDSRVEGVGVASQRSIEVAKTPADGKGLGLRAAYVDLNAPGAEIEPTVHLQLDYTAGSAWAFHGAFHDEASRPMPEVTAGLQMSLLGGSLGLNYSEYAFDPSAQAVRISRIYGAQMARPIAWGLNGTVAYQYTDSLAGDETQAQTIRLALGGDSRQLGKIDLQYQTAETRTSAGSVSGGSTVSLSLTRPVGRVGSISLAARHTEPPGPTPLPADDQVQVDFKAEW